jgi:hypothetical protein
LDIRPSSYPRLVSIPLGPLMVHTNAVPFSDGGNRSAFPTARLKPILGSPAYGGDRAGGIPHGPAGSLTEIV